MAISEAVFHGFGRAVATAVAKRGSRPNTAF